MKTKGTSRRLLFASVIVAVGLVTMPALVRAKAIDYKATIDVRPANGNEVDAIKGFVFEDLNRDGKFQKTQEPGIPGVMVSDGLHVVVTDAEGQYQLPLPTDADEEAGISIFITKPAGFEVPVDADNIPQFFYHHKPNGSPANVRGEPFRFRGLAPTGPLPRLINFPLIKGKYNHTFKIVVSGDTQTYSNNEVGYLRDSLAKELAEMDDVEALIIEGDVLGDDLSLYPRFKKVLSIAGVPQYYVPGNHDLDFDAPSDAHSFDTFKREWGPAYYSFDIGQVHFVVFDDMRYPCEPSPDNDDGLHPFCDNPTTQPTYNGVITKRQIEWLKNNLAQVPVDKLIVLNMHIPLQTYIDMNATQHQVDNALEVYDVLGYGPSGNPMRPALALSGHTHTLEQIRPGELFAGWTSALGERSPGAVPFPQIVVGAACGSWWSGDFTDNGIPMSYQRLGAPRGYLIFEFRGNTYTDQFKATEKPLEKQMSLSLLSPTFLQWSETLMAWLQEDPGTRNATPPVNINDLPDTKIVTLDEINETYLIANVWNGSQDSEVYVKIDGRAPLEAERTQAGEGEGFNEIPDPYALRLQLYSYRFAAVSTSGNERAQGFELFRGSKFGPAAPQPLDTLLTPHSNHLWRVKLPSDLPEGAHVAKVVTVDVNGNTYTETLAFEVMRVRPDQETEAFFQQAFFEVLP
jgi:C terminal of Calcineurin-like phosphoesterase/N terminal of Calcineurin-like phosphoesterase/Calcineurin-like phosphoesterase